MTHSHVTTPLGGDADLSHPEGRCGRVPLSGWFVDGAVGTSYSVKRFALTRSDKAMALLLWILAVILVVSGIVALVRGMALWGIVLIIVGLLVGPGGVSIFTK